MALSPLTQATGTILSSPTTPTPQLMPGTVTTLSSTLGKGKLRFTAAQATIPLSPAAALKAAGLIPMSLVSLMSCNMRKATIPGYSPTSQISLPSNAQYTQAVMGDDVIVSLLGGDAMYLIGSADDSINITGGTRANAYLNYTPNTTLTTSNSPDSVYNYAGGVKILTQAEYPAQIYH